MDTLALLLVIMPGFLVLIFKEHIFHDVPEPECTEIEKTVRGLLASIPVLILNWIFFWVIMMIENKIWLVPVKDIYTLNGFEVLFQDLSFLFVEYVPVSIISSFIIALLFGELGKEESLFFRIINFFRVKNHSAFLRPFPVWEQLLDSDKEQVVEVVTSSGEKFKGFVNFISPSRSGRYQISIRGFDSVSANEDLLDQVEEVFFDLESETVIKFFDMEKIVKRSNEIQNSQEQS